MPVIPINDLPKENNQRPPKLLIGIDPDSIKSGVATYLKQGVVQNYANIKIELLSFFDLYDFLSLSKSIYNDNMLVVIEAGWHNKKANYHGKDMLQKNTFLRGLFADLFNNMGNRDSIIAKVFRISAYFERVSHDVGRNHQTGIMIEEMCQKLNIKYELITPSNHTQKKKNKEFMKKIFNKNVFNQDKADAAMLIVGR